MADSDNSFDVVLSRLLAEFPGVKLLALGQTVYWDEPMKAVLRRRLDDCSPETEMIVGIHDADIFSRVPANLNIPKGWSILPHNDNATRDLWVATGEISSLFGSETIPNRDLLLSYGVQIDKIAKRFPGGRDALIDLATEAWGWRGLVHVDSADEVSCCIPLSEGRPHLKELLNWGFSHTLDMLSDPDSHRGRLVADRLLEEVDEYADTHPGASITDMFSDFLERFYTAFSGRPGNVKVTNVSSLFTFNTKTADLPRFSPLEIFLDPASQHVCREAYDLAVQESDIYALDRFADGAIPFDLMIPGKGRGTICLRDGEVVIDTSEPIVLPTDSVPTTPKELAQLVEEHLGPDTALIGKALTLVLMMASEFIFVLHEQASAYVPRCADMAGMLKERGVNLQFYPILRIAYRTWNSLAACDTSFRLPGHLAAAFRQGEITSREFADLWKSTVKEQEAILERLSRVPTLDELLAFLLEQQGQPWRERIDAYMSAYQTILELSERTQPLKDESIRLRDLSHQIKQEVQSLEMEKGEHFRRTIKPLRDQLDLLNGDKGADLKERLRLHERERAEIESKIEEKRREANAVRNRSLELKHQVRELEKSEEASKARETLNLIEYEAELARMWLVRDAILVSQGLTYADHRPSAWWFMLVDPELRWFERVAETAEFRFEELAASG